MGLNLIEELHHDVYPAIDPKGKLSGVADGKVIVLTGAGKGIGEVLTLIGFTNARRLPKLLRILGQRAL
jgi:hypothetical protein